MSKYELNLNSPESVLATDAPSEQQQASLVDRRVHRLGFVRLSVITNLKLNSIGDRNIKRFSSETRPNPNPMYLHRALYKKLLTSRWGQVGLTFLPVAGLESSNLRASSVHLIDHDLISDSQDVPYPYKLTGFFRCKT